MKLLRSACTTTILLAITSFAGSASAASFVGKVFTPQGNPAYGAMVTVSDAAQEKRETVYTAEDGSFSIRTDFAGTLTVHARFAGFDDSNIVSAASRDEVQHLDLKLNSFANPEAASDALSASAFNARLPWRDVARDRPAFISQCNYCHQIGNATTRIPQSHSEWLATLDKMEALLAMPSATEKSTFADVLSRGFDGNPISAKQSYGASPELAKAKVKEWMVGDADTFIHDADVAQDQKIYGTDEGHDLVWVLDPKTGKIEKYPLPDIDLPRGGLFSGMKLPIGVFSGKHGPHSMAQTRDGRIWITNALSSTLMSFDPKTKQFKTYPVGHDALYPHTVRVDQNDIVWFTIVASNQVGRFDPATEQMTVIRLPSNGFIRWTSDMLFPTLMRFGSWFPDQAVRRAPSIFRSRCRMAVCSAPCVMPANIFRNCREHSTGDRSGRPRLKC
jgi:virginiamycin B lyase